MKITTTEKKGRTIVRMQGDLRISAVAGLKTPLLAALDASKSIGLDLGGIKSCDPAGIQLLLMACASARARAIAVSIESASTAFETALSQCGVSADSLQGDRRVVRA